MNNNKYHTIQVFLKPGIKDHKGEKLALLLSKYFSVDSGKIISGKLFVIDYPISPSALALFGIEGLGDAIVNEVLIDEPLSRAGFSSFITIAKLPGVTDDEGLSAQRTLADMVAEPLDTATQHIFTQDIYLIGKQTDERILKEVAAGFLCNNLINHISCGSLKQIWEPYVPEVKLTVDSSVELIDVDIADNELLALSHQKILSLNLEEMLAIKHYYLSDEVQSARTEMDLPLQPTDCELEIIAQTWSEHCKHKEFNAIIDYTDAGTGAHKRIDSLFKSYIKASTDLIKDNLAKKGLHWLVKVFSDNAGIVRINDENMFVWKVETHNSPSAIDPYGGAITGILGNNRDPIGTGIGGAKLLFNTNVLCFGPPSYDKPLLKGQLHPKRIFEGVRKGIEDGGNKSGIPTINGAIIFDDRYSGKPLVYCGTGGVLAKEYLGRPTDAKTISPGDKIISIGGRVGKDGIHGATFSSREIDEHSPQSAVQIGSPIVQKLASDFLEIACKKGLVNTTTDCGAGGLSSAIGELASISNGAEVMLERVPLKYSGLKPWEIFLSESQERMILAVHPEHLEEVLALAVHMDVEASVIGEFKNDGLLTVTYNGATVASLALDFLHDGVPRKHLSAKWPAQKEIKAEIPDDLDHNEILLKLMASDNISSREYVIRQYDHEVKGKTIIKPLMGEQRNAPQDAAVIRVSFDSFEGIAVSNGIQPKFADLDPYNSSAGAFDEAVRQIIAVGGKLPSHDHSKEVFWSVNDNFCVPDSVYHPLNNPDGEKKLAQLVQMCEALYDMSTFFSVPMTSGKDSMKNDFKADGIKISVPPTLLYSAAAKIDDVRKTTTSDFKKYESLIYQVGKTYEEMGGTEFLNLLAVTDTRAPKVRKEQALRTYEKMMQAHDVSLLLSAHDLSDGGLITALTECCFGIGCGAEITLSNPDHVSVEALLYAESHSRFVVSVAKDDQQKFETILGDDAVLLGYVTETPVLKVHDGNKEIICCSVDELFTAWANGLTEQVQ